MQTNLADRQSTALYFMLAMVGIGLMIVGWYRWAF